jgi:Kef-type K+ transport system membrane component KefB
MNPWTWGDERMASSMARPVSLLERIALAAAVVAAIASAIMLFIVSGFTGSDPPAERIRLLLIYAAPLLFCLLAVWSHVRRWSRVLTVVSACVAVAACVWFIA